MLKYFWFISGCEPDLDFAEALCQILVDQNDEDGRKALHRLQIKKENLCKCTYDHGCKFFRLKLNFLFFKD